MLKRLKAWHIVTAGLIGLSPACGGDARDGDEDRAPVAQESRAARDMPPSVAQRDVDMTSVQPTAPVTPSGEQKPAAEAPHIPEPAEPEESEEEMLDALALAAERNPDDVRPRVKLARALFEAGKRGEARRHAELAVEADDGSSSAWNTLGRIELADRDLEAAVTAFERAAGADPDNSYAWNNLGYVLIELERWDEAAAALENATNSEKPTAYMWNNLGMAYEHLDRIREARAAYRQAAELGSDKGQVNADRLEGVISLVPAGEEPELGGALE
ncbi:MAG TPA: tetratricopeptide repeat protein [Kofleriaceae bacterium]|nr:tetratricopeptide repeat protein [Kofleriaceae bacterium]